MISSHLSFLAAREHVRDLREAAARSNVIDAGPSRPRGVTLRDASPADVDRLQLLADLDSAEVPRGALLVAEVDGHLLAALPLNGAAAVADPFARSAELLELLRLRAAQLGHTCRRRSWRRA
jgi:hypothetical protein